MWELSTRGDHERWDGIALGRHRRRANGAASLVTWSFFDGLAIAPAVGADSPTPISTGTPMPMGRVAMTRVVPLRSELRGCEGRRPGNPHADRGMPGSVSRRVF